jgi:lipooligosaccharide transport system permease protein
VKNAVRALEYWLVAYRRTWVSSLTTSFVNPVLFLTAMGLGLGSLVDDTSVGDIDYVTFLAPGLLAATAMQVGSIDAMYPVLTSVKWFKTYPAQLTTPLGVNDVFFGHLGYIAIRLAVTSAMFMAVMVAFGTVESALVVLALPVCIIVGLVFAAPIAGYTVLQDTDSGMSMITRFVITPMFLFSGTFFPIEQLPLSIRWIAWITPLWHGVALCRGLSLGEMGLIVGWAHLAYLLVLLGIGVAYATRNYRRRLVS